MYFPTEEMRQRGAASLGTQLGAGTSAASARRARLPRKLSGGPASPATRPLSEPPLLGGVQPSPRFGLTAPFAEYEQMYVLYCTALYLEAFLALTFKKNF